MTQQAQTKKNTPVKAVIAAISLALAFMLLAGTGVFAARIPDDVATLLRCQASLSQAREVEEKLRQLVREVADTAEEIAKRLETTDFSDTDDLLALPDRLNGVQEQISDELKQLSELCGEDYSFLIDSLPVERYKELLQKHIRRQLREKALNGVLGKDNPLRDFADGLFGNEEEAEDLDLADELRRLLDFDFVGALEKKTARARRALIRDLALSGAAFVLSAGAAVTGFLLLKTKRNNGTFKPAQTP